MLNRSAAMAGIPFEAIQTAAGRLIDLVTEATGGTVDGLLEGGSRMGIVSFSDEAYVSQPFTVSAKELKAAVNGLFTQGLANHAAAFETGAGLFDPDSENEKVMVLFSDGVNTAGGPPSPAAAAAKKAGISLYCIGLPGAEGLDRENLLQWASAPVYSHTAFPEDGAQLPSLHRYIRIQSEPKRRREYSHPGAGGSRFYHYQRSSPIRRFRIHDRQPDHPVGNI